MDDDDGRGQDDVQLVAQTVVFRDIWQGRVTDRRLSEPRRRGDAGQRKDDGDRTRVIATLLRTRQQERRAMSSSIKAETLQLLASMHVQLGRLRSRLHDPDQLDVAARIDETLRMAEDQLRRLTCDLKPPVLDLERGLGEAIARYVAELGEASGERYRVWSDLTDEPSPEAGDAIYLLVQVALANLRLQGGGAVTDITLTSIRSGVLLTVAVTGEQQNAVTPDALIAVRVSLLEMQEYADADGGWCEATDDADQRVFECWIPSAQTVGRVAL
jgi:signal transduction histidine kinase